MRTVIFFLTFFVCFSVQANTTVLSGGYVVEIEKHMHNKEIKLFRFNASGNALQLLYTKNSSLVGDIKDVVVSRTPEPSIFILDEQGFVSYFSESNSQVKVRAEVKAIGESPTGIIVADDGNQLVELNFAKPENGMSFETHLIATAMWMPAHLKGQISKIQLLGPDEFVAVSDIVLIHGKGFFINTKQNPDLLDQIDLTETLENETSKSLKILKIYDFIAQKKGAWIHANTTENSKAWVIDFQQKKVLDHFNLPETGTLLDIAEDKLELHYTSNGHDHLSIIPKGLMKLQNSQLLSPASLYRMGASFPAVGKDRKTYVRRNRLLKSGESALTKKFGPHTLNDFLILLDEVRYSLKPGLKMTLDLFCEIVNTSTLLRYSFEDLKPEALRKFNLYLQAGWLRPVAGKENELFSKQDQLAHELSIAVCEKILIPKK